MKRAIAPVALLVASLVCAPHASAESPPVEDFFKNPEFTDMQLSPSGKYLATLAPIEGHRNIVVIETDGLKNLKPLTGLKDQDVSGFFWASDDVIVFTMDADGNEGFGLYAVDRDRDKPKIRTLVEPEVTRAGIRFATVVSTLPDDPDHIIVQWNKRSPRYFGLYKVNVRKGRPVPMTDGLNGVTDWLVDHDGVPRGALVIEGLEGTFLYRDGADHEFRPLRKFNLLDEGITPLGFAYDNKTMYVASDIGRRTRGLYTYDPNADELGEMLFGHDEVDIGDLIMSHAQKKLLGVSYFDDYPRRHFFDDVERGISERLGAAFPGKAVNVVSTSKDETLNVLLVYSDRDPGNYYLYDRKAGQVRFLVSRMEWIDPERMSPMQPLAFTARDGMKLRGYLTVPADRKDGERIPLIVNPHGGPFGVRDYWSYNPEHQFLSSRGYAVVQVNYRGSGGYGREFEQAGYGKWGREMQHDLSDAVSYLVDEGIVDPERVCIYGGSYGGYATMAGLTFTPELYRCGINYVGVTDVALLFDSMPKHWEPLKELLKVQIGDPEDEQFMDSISPIAHVENIDDPVLIVHGRRDPRVVIKHATKLRRQMKRSEKPFEWLVKNNEGHGFSKEENRIELYRTMENFLSTHL
ncbi:MAG: S9 family peptidase [Proteobacteria bacterium]|nr:S9 family peptidase [Pseudomonadota bacterium]